MAPEQATGGTVDARSDIFSFGAMLYEMATGTRAFAGTSTVDTLAAVIRAQPTPPTAVVPALPRELERLILRCLRKDPDRRYQNIRDVSLELQAIKEESDSGRLSASVPAPDRRRARLIPAVIVAAVAVVAAIVIAWMSKLKPACPLNGSSRSTALNGLESAPTFSPDGDQVAFAWNGEKQDNDDIYLKLVGSSELRRLTTDALSDGPRLVAGRPRNRVRAPRPPGLHSPPGFASGWTRPKAGILPRGHGSAVVVSGQPLRGRGAHVAVRVGGIGVRGALPPARGGRRAPPHRASAGDRQCLHAQGLSGRRRLAFQACIGFACHVDVVDLGADFVTKGPPRRLTRRAIKTWGGLAWTRDGRSVLFVESGFSRLWRVGVDGTPPVPVELAGLKAMLPSAAVSRDRLVFTRLLTDGDIYRFEAGRPAEPVLSSLSTTGPSSRRMAAASRSNPNAPETATTSGLPRPTVRTRSSSRAGRASSRARLAGRRTARASLSTPRERTGCGTSGRSTWKEGVRAG